MNQAPQIARVEPLTLTRAVRGPFDYRLRSDQSETPVGALVRVPFGGRSMLGVVVGLASSSELALDRLAEPEAIIGEGLPTDLVELAGWLAAEYCSTQARALRLLLGPAGSTSARERAALVAQITPEGQALLKAGHPPPTGRPPTANQLELLRELASRGPVPAALLGTPALRRLQARGWVAIAPTTVRRSPERHRIGTASVEAPELTAEQRDAVRSVREALRSESPQSLLLHGVTGSGKTEVYLQAVHETLAAGRSAIVLVPEIALTPQALQRFEARFADRVAVIHSGLSEGQRHDEWLRCRRGEARVCVGARSAVFAPLADIGLIVVDEEHESSYKHEGDPRYDARAVAAERARRHGALLLAGSATPRPESAQRLERVRLRRRVDGRDLPHVEVVDMRAAHHPLHPRTRAALSDLRRDGGKAIVLLNRRGWSNFLSCQACGHVWMCPNCEVALVLHRGGGFVACHHCGHREQAGRACPACGSVSVARHGAGTERLEHELTDALSGEGFPVLRLDADAVGLGRRARILERFSAAPAGVLIGTQMVAKGHDFPDVALGVVLDADATLRFPDFRSEERTFALITQLAGRAGRAGAAGRVLVQTLAPEARSIRFASGHDADGFLADELARRRALNYPPFSSLVRIVCSSIEPAPAAELALSLRGQLHEVPGSVLGPAPLFRLRGRSRSQLVIKAQRRRPAIALIGAAVDGLAREASRRGVSVSVDVDPQ